MSTERVAMIAHVVRSAVVEIVRGESVARVGVVVHRVRRGADENWSDALEPTDLTIHGDPAEMMGLQRGVEVLVRGILDDDPATGRRALFGATVSPWCEPAATAQG